MSSALLALQGPERVRRLRARRAALLRPRARARDRGRQPDRLAADRAVRAQRVGKSSLLSAAVARSLRELPEKPLVVVFSRWSDDPPGPRARRSPRRAVEPTTDRRSARSKTLDGRDVYLVLDQTRSTSSTTPTTAGLDRSPRRCRRARLAASDQRPRLPPGGLAREARPLHRPHPGCSRTRFGWIVSIGRRPKAAITGPIDRYASSRAPGDHRARAHRARPRRSRRRADRTSPRWARRGRRSEAALASRLPTSSWSCSDSGRTSASGSDTLRRETLGRLGGAQHIVEEHLEGAMNALTSGQKDSRALFNHLVTPSGTKIAHEISDLADFGQVPIGELQPVLSTLSERRILRSLEEVAASGTRSSTTCSPSPFSPGVLGIAPSERSSVSSRDASSKKTASAAVRPRARCPRTHGRRHRLRAVPTQ